ncbi:ATP-binding protein [Microbacterium sediminicola]|uniref:ATP-binding protein n=1 Tax=Microbacterium sediminicola TaxID=415210 RepID=A0ABP4UFK8_9MICO
MDELENPYRPGAGTQPPALIGRDAYIDHFGTLMRRAVQGRPGKSVMPIGLRGVGKTVLLNRFAQIAETEGLSVAFIEAPETGDLRSLLARSLRKILLQFDGRKASAKVLKALRILKSFQLQLPDGSSVSLDFDALAGAGDSGVLSDDLTDLLTAAGEAAQERSTGILIAIDEVQYLTAEELSAAITAIHRTTQLNLPVVLVGAGLPQLPGLAGDAKSYAERLFEFPEIGSLNAEDARDALALPAAVEGVEYSAEAIELLLALTEGYPYFLQEWGYHLWNISNGPTIGIGDVQSAQQQVTSHLDKNFFLVRLDRLTPKEKEYLLAMAQLGKGPHRSGDIAAKLGVKVESVAPRRSGLISKGMIYSPAHGDTAFTVPLFDAFMMRTSI